MQQCIFWHCATHRCIVQPAVQAPGLQPSRAPRAAHSGRMGDCLPTLAVSFWPLNSWVGSSTVSMTCMTCGRVAGSPQGGQKIAAHRALARRQGAARAGRAGQQYTSRCLTASPAPMSRLRDTAAMPATEPLPTNRGLPSTLRGGTAAGSPVGWVVPSPSAAHLASMHAACSIAASGTALRRWPFRVVGSAPHSLLDVDARALVGGLAGAVCQVGKLVGGGQDVVQLQHEGCRAKLVLKRPQSASRQ